MKNYFKGFCEVCKKDIMSGEPLSNHKKNLCKKCDDEPSAPYEGVYVGGMAGLVDENDRDGKYYEDLFHVRAEHSIK